MAQEYAEVNSIQTNDSPGNGAETKYFDLSLFDEWMDDVQSPFYDLVGMAMPKSGQETPEIMEPRAVRETPLNSYADYVATEGEYDVHPYEWASNFYAFSDAMASKNADTNFIQTKDGLGYDSDNESVTMSVFDEWIKTPHSPAGHLYTEGDNEEDGLLGYGPTNHPFVQAAHPSSNPAYFSDGQDVRPGAGHGQYAGTPDSDVTVTEKSMQRGGIATPFFKRTHWYISS